MSRPVSPLSAPLAGAFATLFVIGLAVACSGTTKSSGFDQSSGGSSSGGSSGSSGASGSSGSSGLIDTTDGGGATGDAAACAASSETAKQKPLDMYIMLDQSGSMKDLGGGTTRKWDAITSALTEFVQQPSVAGIGVGLGYFGSTRGNTCDAASYATPEVEIATLPGNASAIVSSMGKHGPGTGTPTAPALQGTIEHAKEWQTAHPDRVTVVVLATDGLPEACSPQDIPSVAKIAANGKSGAPSILTFVIGVGDLRSNLDAIAAGGGTNQAFIVDTTGNATQQFLDALNKIRGAALGCQYQIPAPSGGGAVDFDSVNVEYTPGGGKPITFPKVADKSQCPSSGNAWYYDNNAAPTEIILCDATCSTVSGDANGALKILLGCKTVVK